MTEIGTANDSFILSGSISLNEGVKMTNLSKFITKNFEPILIEWERFAATLFPEGQQTDRSILRDHGKEMLEAIALRIGFSNALFPSRWHPGTRQNTTPGALESVFEGGCGLLGVDSAAESRPSWAPPAGCPWSPARFHRSPKPSDAADSSGPGRRVA